MQNTFEMIQLAIAITTLITIVYGVLKVVVPFAKHAIETPKQLAWVVAELKPNGGSSLRDSINRVEKSLESIQDDAARMDARQWAIVASLLDPVWESDATGKCLRVNPAMLALTHRSMDDYLGNNWENTVKKEDRERVWEEWTDAVARRRVFISNFTVASTDGAEYSVEAVAAPYVSQKTGEVMGWVGRYHKVLETKPRKA